MLHLPAYHAIYATVAVDLPVRPCCIKSRPAPLGICEIASCHLSYRLSDFMPEFITTHSVARGFAKVDDIELCTTARTRTVFRPGLHAGGVRGAQISGSS